MGKPSAPPPPDPVATAQAQTAQNTTTAIANAHLQNVNQITPWGNQTYEVTGYHTVEDPLSTTTQQSYPYSAIPPQGSAPADGGPGSNRKTVPGSNENAPTGIPNTPMYLQETQQGGSYQVPTFTATTTLPPDQQAALNAQFATNKVLSNTALDQSKFLEGYLGNQIDVSDLPAPNSYTPFLSQYEEVSTADQSKRINPNIKQQWIDDSIDPTQAIQSDISRPDYAPRTYGTDFSEDRQRVEDALMGRMDPYLQRNRADLQTQLANQGITPGSEAYDRAMSDLERQENDARMGAILSAGQEQSRLTGLERDRAMFESGAQSQEFGQNLAMGDFANRSQGQDFAQKESRANFYNDAANMRFTHDLARAQHFNTSYDKLFAREAQNRAMYNAAKQAKYNSKLTDANLDNSVRQQMLNERFALRNQPINEIAALMSGSQVQNPGFGVNTPGAIPTTDFAGITNAAHAQAMQGYNAEMAQYNNLMGGLFGLGAAGIGLL